ncbi:OmpH family outer membrane protein [Falsigemmobacter intermedius]|uniref:OmpH family outer membrane protein n=1 Tax=Falsigemmobacter intermedius TaxID=1553448 RepID=A0A3S3V0J0_9RHOB|nr:OmpH family outer membrane protein [Falsigemmobacter intermedius]RWY39601.1 OmpH family outer membrane protein [Falsigemmobacter intermedius]
MLRPLRQALCGLAFTAALSGGGVFAEESGAVQFGTLNEARLFAGSRLGQAMIQRFETAQLALAAENREIEARLTAREQDLTRQRKVLSTEEFRRLSDQFNAEVESYRRTQADKERALYLEHDADRRRFSVMSNDVLTRLMRDRGLYAIIAEDAIILAFRGIDITEAMIARMDAEIDEEAIEAEAEAPPQTGGPAPSRP